MNKLAALPSLSALIASHQLAAKKSLGQHFLLDNTITDDVARFAGKLDGHHIIEIGPGPGGLTRSLLNTNAKHVYVVEKDDRCIAIMKLMQEAAPERLTILHEDALSVDLLKEVSAPRRIIANLPYNVGTEMLLRWLDQIYTHGQGAFESLTLMFQKEVAERITATHGNKHYGRLSVICQWLCEVSYDMELPPEAFTPPPKVSSAVVTLTPRAKPLVDVDKSALEKVMAAAFGQRRKMLRKSLKSLGCDVDELLEKTAIDGTLRAEQVELKSLCELAKAYQSPPINSGKPS